MKILIVSNLYPPHYVGGYELRCAQVAGALRRLGHEVQVVTSTYGLEEGPRREVLDDVPVHRCLHQYAFPPYHTHRPYMFFQARSELSDARHLHRIAADFQPDIINFWSMYGLSGALLPLPRLWGIPDVYWIEHWWMIDQYGKRGEKAQEFWTRIWDGTWGPVLIRPLLRAAGRVWEGRVARGRLPTRDFSVAPAHVVFVSRFMAEMHREAGLAFPSSEVIYGGVPVDRFYQAVSARPAAGSMRVLYAGQLSRDRGLHSIVEALGIVDPGLRAGMRLDVVGQGSPEYEIAVKARVAELGLSGCVSFAGRVPHERMPSLYREHDLLVFPSARPEGLPLTMIEAMLAGCAVVTTGSGGAGEIAEMAELPTFPVGDAQMLADLLSRLLTDRAELARIARRGQQVALAEFGFDRMIERFVSSLARLPKQRSA